MSLASEYSPGPDLPFGPFPSPYGDAINAPIFSELLNSTLRGEAHAPEPVALPDDAMMEVRLLDISLADGPAITLAKNTIVPANQLPIAFEMAYDSHQIKRGCTYSISATIRSKGKLLYANDCTHLVFTASHSSHIKLRLTPIG